MEDYIIKATAGDGTIRAVAATTANMVKESQNIHGLSPLATVALGRTMTAAVMMSTTLKGEKDTITVQIKGDGPIGGIVVVSDSQANVKGYVHRPLVYLPLNSNGKFDVAGNRERLSQCNKGYGTKGAVYRLCRPCFRRNC